MTSNKWLIACLCAVTSISSIACNPGNTNSGPASETNSSATQPSGAEAGVEKQKPAPGTGNVQGKVLYNGKPAENIEVKLCEKFNQFIGGCSEKSYTARTDKNGEYLIANVEPKKYESLLARVFETESYVFATSGVAGLSSTQYEVPADKTVFVTPINLFKGDLKTLAPKAGAKVSAQDLELKWEPYPDAAYYKFSLYPDESSTLSPHINERVDATSFVVSKPLQKGTYRLEVGAYNTAGQKLSENSDDIKFTVTDGAAP